ncbi:hypothetical protein [Stratiformator vulcanicus]|uniref:Nudix hydrolase domain-containing protein n=1 Tax=Stratiformator vulcanicus TaxID=2527980 RepID=A0A517R338_9PLAN|nr:hypothetical protein [Stratiformator vulcanicus]QDT38257.1 hypothetical protein Pan189_26470 [Stratiformator vulcanicus]
MKQFVGSIAILRRTGETGGDEFLGLWSDGRACYHFPEVHKLDDESFRQSLIREIGWMTGLDGKRDFIVSGAPRAHIEAIEEGKSPDENVVLVAEFYLAEFMGKRWQSHLDEAVRENRASWISKDDIEAGHAPDRRPICSRLLSLLRTADMLRPWQSE